MEIMTYIPLEQTALKETMMTSAAGNNSNMLLLRERGFSLLELIVVIFILSLVMAVSYPSLSRGASSLHLRTTGRDILNTFRLAREKAISEQTGMQLAIDREKQEIVLSDNLGENGRKYFLPRDVKIHRMAMSDHEVFEGFLIIRFFPNGSADNARLLLKSENGSLLQIISDPFSGGARIETPAGESFP
jgi:prepilin-type N-terminal cleavage/methylation domain-containing protein